MELVEEKESEERYWRVLKKGEGGKVLEIVEERRARKNIGHSWRRREYGNLQRARLGERGQILLRLRASRPEVGPGGEIEKLIFFPLL